MKTKKTNQIENDLEIIETIKTNLFNAIKKMHVEAKDYTDTNYTCGFRLMDNGTLICQVYYGKLWVYSNEEHFVFGKINWENKVSEHSIPCSKLLNMCKEYSIKEIVRDYSFRFIQEYQSYSYELAN